MNLEPNEYELALRARAGDRDALAELVERTRSRLFALAYAELRHYEDAQDAVAAALVQICRHVDDLREPERVRAWMNSIVRNEVRRIRRPPDDVPVSLEETEAYADDVDLTLLRLDIERALRRLPGNQACALRLFYLDDLSIREIAWRLGCAEGTVRVWLHRGRRHLATEMEDYAPMTPPQTAVIVHTDLEADQIQTLTTALQAIGYQVNAVTPGDLPGLKEAFKKADLIVLDEWFGGRSALELLINLRADPETRDRPVFLLCSDPSDLTVIAYFNAGVDRLVRKEDLGEVARVAPPKKPPASMWQPFTARARRAVQLGHEEARRLGHDAADTLDLLYGIVRSENLGSGVLEHMGVSLEQIQKEIERRTIPGSPNATPDMQLSPAAKQAIDLAYAEALSWKHTYIGCEHLLLGLLREGGAAAQIMTDLGVDLERVRQEIPVVGAPWFDVLEAERRLADARTAYRSFLGGT
jgi:RNA polymerase sigma factor (sigma-70 family)